MGGFHIAMNFLSVIGKMYAESGLEDLLVESGVYAAGSTTALLAGKQYNRGVRAHKLVEEALFRLSWKAFEKWLQERPNDEQPRISMEKVYSVINDCRKAMKGIFAPVNCQEMITVCNFIYFVFFCQVLIMSLSKTLRDYSLRSRTPSPYLTLSSKSPEQSQASLHFGIIMVLLSTFSSSLSRRRELVISFIIGYISHTV